MQKVIALDLFPAAMLHGFEDHIGDASLASPSAEDGIAGTSLDALSIVGNGHYNRGKPPQYDGINAKKETRMWNEGSGNVKVQL